MKAQKIKLCIPNLNKIYYFCKNSISLKAIAGESKAITTEMITPWNEMTLMTLLSNYKIDDAFSAYEVGLFYQCLSNKNFHLSAEKCSEGKKGNVRLASIVAASVTGEKFPMFTIDELKTPQ